MIIRRWRWAFTTLLCVLGWAATVTMLVISIALLHLDLFGLALLGAAMVVAGYVALAMLLNRTTFRLKAGVLDVTHGPLPWTRGCHRFDMRQVALVRIDVTRKIPKWAWLDVLFEFLSDTDYDGDDDDTEVRSIAAVYHSGHKVPILQYSAFLVPQAHVLSICEAINRFLATSAAQRLS